ncbi:MAG: purine-binding chemotaxis protein CheW [Phycisphaerae bacterium]|nr:purine-binding chemotaxis protein CheW [Phycisphaerae bacterium]
MSTITQTISSTGQATATPAGKFLTFGLAQEEFGIEILKVREIIGIMDVTAVPQMPSYMRGVINLRGRIIPVFSLRLRFGLPDKEDTDETCVIVVDIGHEVGLIVDRVSEVVDIPADAVEPPPAVGTQCQTKMILGMGKIGEAIKILLDVDAVLSADEIEQFTHAEVLDA